MKISTKPHGRCGSEEKELPTTGGTCYPNGMFGSRFYSHRQEVAVSLDGTPQFFAPLFHVDAE
ncbi:MAG: hypothetical protein P4L99_29245 [Chthoniobacter sp.]|nr:hypothetical protein [Chthoniobacter sp.]